MDSLFFVKGESIFKNHHPNLLTMSEQADMIFANMKSMNSFRFFAYVYYFGTGNPIANGGA